MNHHSIYKVNVSPVLIILKFLCYHPILLATTSRPSVDISTLYKQLEQSGLFSGGNIAPPPNTRTVTPTPQLGPPIADISLTIASIKRFIHVHVFVYTCTCIHGCLVHDDLFRL